MVKRILILGVGNTLLGDEGFGVHALRMLEEEYDWPDNIRLVDGGTLGLLLLAELLECELVIILDIARGGHEPGTFYQLDGEALNPALSFRQSMHQTSISDTLISCELAGHRPEALIYAMEPYDMENLNPDLTDAARAKLPEFCDRVIKELARIDIHPAKKKSWQKWQD